MSIEVTKKRFTVDEYYQMAKAGILGPGDRVELIEGEIIEMSPIGDRHATRVLRAIDFLSRAFAGRALVNVQNPLQLSDYTEPQPDLVVLKLRADYYSSKKIRAEDALLVIEVSDTTIRYDRNIKLPLYAAAGIPEVWIEDLESGQLLVYRNPVNKIYSTRLNFRRGESISLLAFPDITFIVEDLLG
jgi:hypothetical protein